MPVKHCLRGTCSSDSTFRSFVKASVLCPLPNQRERLKRSFIRAKPAGVPRASPMSAKLYLFLITRSGRNFARERSAWASQMTISKRCDVLSCFLFVVVAGQI